ncbi:MAG: hypothetical protein IJS09_07870 [Treponema sp.]|nr:hypothetical protein [Treponema sp.]
MNETRTETVLIPHPNELKKLADAQKKTLQAIQEICSDKVIWAPIFPLYVCEFDNNKKNTFDAEGKKISGCELTDAYVENNRIILNAKLTAADDIFYGILTLAKCVRTNADTAQDTNDMQKTIASIFGDILPLRLPVFRVALADFSQTGTQTAWSVRESRWVKMG